MSGAGSPGRPIEPPSPPGGDRGPPPPCVHTEVIPGGVVFCFASVQRFVLPAGFRWRVQE